MEPHQIYDELRQENFSAEEFVEVLAHRATSSYNEFNVSAIASSFTETIRDLKILDLQLKKKEKQLEEACRKVEKKHWERVAELLDRNEEASGTLGKLAGRVNAISNGVAFLGDQLDRIHGPRSRVIQAQKLMKYFSDFVTNGQPLPEVFTDRGQLFEAANIIQQLHQIVDELPKDKYSQVKQNIEKKYFEIEVALIEEFVSAQEAGDLQRMKKIATVLAPFRSYLQCVDAFIEHSQTGAFLGRDIFVDINNLCEKNAPVIKQIFQNPDQVMARFVLCIYNGALLRHVEARLADRSDPDRYLKTLFEMYTRITKLSTDLSKYDLEKDSSYLTLLTNNIFKKYLATYPKMEEDNLRLKFEGILNKYYESKGHEKKQFATGGAISELRREVQAAITARTNIQFSNSDALSEGETLLSEELAVHMLQESKQTLKRCQVLLSGKDRTDTVVRHCSILLDFLISNHLEYGVEAAIQSIPASEFPKGAPVPQIFFYETVHQGTAIVHLLEKHFVDIILPCFKGTAEEEVVLSHKKNALANLENKFGIGIDRSISAAIGWSRSTLQNEQKRTDFKPETDDVIPLATSPCLKVTRFIEKQGEAIKNSLDGHNFDAVLTELGTRFHRTVYEHLQQFQFNLAGGMSAICDVSEYRKGVSSWKLPVLETFFDALHALCNLLVVPPTNLKQVCSGEHLASLDESIILSFVQLRADYKSGKLAQFL